VSSGDSGLLPYISDGLDRLKRESQERARVEPLPTWSEHLRGAPNALLRSALFGVQRRGRRRYVKGMTIPSQRPLTMTYTGERLDQADLDILLQILHYARGKRAEEPIVFATGRLLGDIGRCNGRSDYLWIRGRLEALSACTFVVSDDRGNRIYTGPFISGAQSDREGRSAFQFNTLLRPLFENYTLIRWDDRLELKGKQLAKWLHAYFVTHALAHPLKVTTLMAWCGTDGKSLKEFRRQLRNALGTLQQRGHIQSYFIDGTDLVHVRGIPSASQAKHLMRKLSGQLPLAEPARRENAG